MMIRDQSPWNNVQGVAAPRGPPRVFYCLFCVINVLVYNVKNFHVYWVTEDWVVGNFTVFSVTLSPIMLHNNITNTYILHRQEGLLCRLKGRAFFMKISVVLLHSALKFEKKCKFREAARFEKQTFKKV